MSGTPTSDAAESPHWARQARADVLLDLMPALIHRFNNSISVILGMAEVALAPGPSEDARQRLQPVLEHARASAQLLRGLSDVAVGLREPAGMQDLRQMLRGMVDFLLPLAQARAEIRLGAARGLALTRVDAEHVALWMLLALCESSAALRGACWEGRGERVRASAIERGERVLVRVSARASAGPGGPRPQRLAVLERLGAELGGRVRCRRMRGGACCLELSLPIVR